MRRLGGAQTFLVVVADGLDLALSSCDRSIRPVEGGQEPVVLVELATKAELGGHLGLVAVSGHSGLLWEAVTASRQLSWAVIGPVATAITATENPPCR